MHYHDSIMIYINLYANPKTTAFSGKSYFPNLPKGTFLTKNKRKTGTIIKKRFFAENNCLIESAK